MKTAFFRADSSFRIGTGHIMRCLTLASRLKQHNFEVIFLAKNHPGNINQLITTQGFKLIELSKPEIDVETLEDESKWLGCQQSQDANECIEILADAYSTTEKIDLLIVDHYSLDSSWQQTLRARSNNIVVIDDLANRRHQCDLLIDQTYGRLPRDYQNLVPDGCQLLLGKEFMLLRDEFSQLRSQAIDKRKITTEPAKLLISLGGTDPDNISGQLIQWLIKLKPEYPQLAVTTVVSPNSQHLPALKALCDNHNYLNLLAGSSSMAKLMLDADFAIGASGGTAWERCALALPTINIITAHNQKTNSENLSEAKAIYDLGWYQDISFNQFEQAINTVLTNKTYHQLSNSSAHCCDGLGTTRVIKQLLTLLQLTQLQTGKVNNSVKLRVAQLSDCKVTFNWQSNKTVRKYLRNNKPVQWQEHQNWFAKAVNDPSKKMYIIELDKEAVGVLRFDKQSCPEETEQLLHWEISIIVSPLHQGKKIAQQALAKISTLFDSGVFQAEVHQDNIASQTLFTQAGFKRKSTTQFVLTLVKDSINNRVSKTNA